MPERENGVAFDICLLFDCELVVLLAHEAARNAQEQSYAVEGWHLLQLGDFVRVELARIAVGDGLTGG